MDARAGGSQVRVRVLGVFVVEGLDYVGSRKARTLLKILTVARGRSVSTDRLALCLWGDQPPANANKEMSVLVSRLRSVIGTNRITHSDAGYRFTPDWLDFTAAIEATQAASECLIAGDHAEALRIASEALGLFAGPLLDDEPGADWAEPHRVTAARLAAQIRHISGLAALRLGDLELAARMAEEQLEHDRYDEGAIRMLMAARAAQGRPAAAIAAYSRFRQMLRDELGTEPGAACQQSHVALLKGEAIPGFVVGQPARQVPETVRSNPGQNGTLPGREVELAALHDGLVAASQGRTQFMGLVGESGMGKTRVLDEFCGMAAGEGATVLRATCYRWNSDQHLMPLVDAFGAYLQSLPQDETAKLLGQDRSLSVVGIRAPDTNAELAQPLEPGLRAYWRLTLLVERMSADGVVVLALDDLHQASAGTIDWLRYVARYAPRTSLLVVATWPPSQLRMPQAFHVQQLRPLDLEAVAHLVGWERAEGLHRRTAGNPRLILELAAADGDGVPEAAMDRVAIQLLSLGDAALTLKTAAVLGPVVRLRTLAPMLGLAVGTVLQHLEAAQVAGILVERDAELAFKNEVIREAILRLMPKVHREFLLEQAAAHTRSATGYGRRATDGPVPNAGRARPTRRARPVRLEKGSDYVVVTGRTG